MRRIAKSEFAVKGSIITNNHRVLSCFVLHVRALPP
ncbi:hypothetical protein ABIB85_004398 [Bradyrhizobium sp. JR1.5]